MSEEVVFEGTVEKIVYQNEQNGYCVFELSVDCEDLTEIVATGVVPSIVIGDSMKIYGSFVTHPTYGKQLKIDAYEKSIPSTEMGMEKYLGSGVVKGVREKLAKKIVEKFGIDTFDVIENYPEKLASIKGINLEKAMSISAVFHEQAQMRRVLLYLQNLGISNTYSLKIYKAYKDNTIEKVQANPYCLADDVFGIGFKLADNIASNAGVSKDSNFRIESGIKYTLNQATLNGHVYLPISILLREASSILEIPMELIENRLSQMQIDRAIWLEKLDDSAIVYLNSYFYAENNVAKKLVELCSFEGNKNRNFNKEIEKYEKRENIKLADNQKKAVEEALKNGVLVVTGGPGTGKTTTIKTIIDILKKDEAEIILAAPTGRAAKRMSETSLMEAKTIHRLLEISFSEDNSRNQFFGKNKDNPVEASVIIIDETSMVDILLMNSLLSAISVGTKLILVGDVDQLPSVGAGNVLRDIIDSGVIPVVRLNEIFRQAEESAIVMNAHRINKGEYPILNEKEKDFFFSQKDKPDLIINEILELVCTRLPKYAKCNTISDIQVLTPMRKGPVGVSSLNQVLQEKLNPKSNLKKEWAFRSVVFREGDRVMQIKNNYNLGFKIYENNRLLDEGVGVFNGDMGVITSINITLEKITVLFDENKFVEYDFSLLDELELAYAITIHKSQGSEYKVVVMPIFTGASLLMTRNLLYTAVTRAKKLTVLVGIKETLNYMVDNKSETDRYSALNLRIIKMRNLLRGYDENI